jgi:hypothetical protein
VPVELTPVLAAGLVSGIAMLAAQIAAAGRLAAFDIVAFWSVLLGQQGPRAGLVGLVVHLLVSVGVAAGYALGFRVGGITDMGWAWGLIGGVIHWVAAGAFVAIVPGGTETATAPSPGAFGRQLGPNGGLAFLAAHLVFGLVVGIVYLALHSSGGLGAAL